MAINYKQGFYRYISTGILVIIFLLTIQYYHTEIYYKEQNSPFQGSFLYNPYALFKTNPIRANFHAHSKAHFNLTNGSQNPNEVYSFYRDQGYDIISLSNYQKITQEQGNPNYIPVYEHGYGIRKTHQLVINAEKVSYFDFPLFQTYHHKQQVLQKLKTPNNLVAIAHPLLWDGYRVDDFKYLKGFDLMEIFNNRKTFTNIWDEALSNGYMVWLLANDDTHDIRRTDHTLVSWTRIGVNSKSREVVLDAMRMGCHYGVKNLQRQEYNFLDSLVMDGNTINVYFRNIAGSIAFISDGGQRNLVVDNVASASYTIKPNETYVRVEAISGGETLCLNPVIRYDGINLPFNSASPRVNILFTVLFRFLVLITSSFAFILILLLNPKLKRRVLRWRLLSLFGRWKLG